MRKVLIFLLYLAFGMSLAHGKQCESDSLASVSSGGKILIMISGAVYEVDAYDRLDSTLWLGADDVLTCDDGEIINTDESGETVNAVRLK